MKKKLFFIILFAFVLCACSKDIELDNEKWSYENGKLKISFILKNNGYSEVYRKVRITARKQRNIGKGAIVSDVLGEKLITVYMRPHEEKKITDTVELFPNLLPSMVVFNHFESK